jgi:hypothetical protein
MRLERNLAGVAALGAGSIKHLTRTALATLGLAVLTASLASLGLVGKALLGVKFLLTCSKGEFLSAILADQSFVAVHCKPSFSSHIYGMCITNILSWFFGFVNNFFTKITKIFRLFSPNRRKFTKK